MTCHFYRCVCLGSPDASSSKRPLEFHWNSTLKSSTLKAFGSVHPTDIVAKHSRNETKPLFGAQMKGSLFQVKCTALVSSLWLITPCSGACHRFQSLDIAFDIFIPISRQGPLIVASSFNWPMISSVWLDGRRRRRCWTMIDWSTLEGSHWKHDSFFWAVE